MSADANHTNKIVFGGHVLAQADRIAFCEVLKFLEERKSVCNEAVTYKLEDIIFHCPAYLGDIVTLKSSVASYKEKSVVVDVRGKVWRNSERKTLQFFQGRFIFVTKKDDVPTNF
jgi:acyl-CoA hydrolase